MDKLTEKLLHERITPLKSLLEQNPANTHRITISPDPENDSKYIITGVDESKEPMLYKRAAQIQTALESWATHRSEVVIFPDPDVPGRYTFEIVDRLNPIPVETAEDDGTDRPEQTPETGGGTLETEEKEEANGQTDVITKPAKSSRSSRKRD